jgi:hypothetical protein
MTPTPTPRYWSWAVSEHNNSLDLESGVITWDDPLRIAHSLQHSADLSRRRKVELRRLYGRG